MTITQRGPLTGLSAVAAPMSEDRLVGHVIALAGALGWRAFRQGDGSKASN